MKSVKIIGKRNVDSFKPKNERKRKILDKLSEKNILIKENQHKLVKRLCANEDFSGNIFVKKELERKIKSYRAQDIKKHKLNEEKLIKMDECIDKLVLSKMKCYYCMEDMLLVYENVREPKQWTLDRIDNSKGHITENVVISCLDCNLKRRTMSDKKFKFSKQMKIIKKN
tara:strand:- start:11221 stop:11730 length:510 start_codon:yes stop_codon:yes gene_type:complete